MGTSYYTVCEEVDISASEEAKWYGRPIGPNVQVSLPDSKWDRMDIIRVFAIMEEARSSAKTLAEGLQALKPKGTTGFFGSARRNAERPELVAAREAIERAVRDWAGPDCLVMAID
jgi:hypothetical protein